MRIARTLTLEDGGRQLDFSIRPMSAYHLESWLMRVAEIMPPENAQTSPQNPTALAERILKRGLLALACGNPDKAAPILEDLLRCCAAIDRETGGETPCSAQNINDHIADVRTLFSLRNAALRINLSFAFEGSRKPLVLPKEWAFRRAVTEQTHARTANVPQITAALISQGAASLNGLRTTYSYADALDLLEVLNVRNYNHWATQETARGRRR